MNKVILALSISIIALSSAHANNKYVNINILGSSVQDTAHKNKKGTEISLKVYKSFGGSVGFGYVLNKNINLELAVQYSHENLLTENFYGMKIDHKFNIITPMIKLYYNYYFNDSTKFYIGAGTGPSWTKLNLLRKGAGEGQKQTKNKLETDSKMSMAFAGYAGFGKRVNNIDYELGYSFGYYGQTCEKKNNSEIYPLDIYMHSINFGIKFYL